MHPRHTIAISISLLLACAREQDTPPEQDTDASASATDTASADTTASDSGGSDSGGDCVGPGGCYACTPTQNEQLLNHCTEAACEPFPNTPERLPLLMPDGSLPPLP